MAMATADRLPHDVLHQIFALALPMSYSSPVDDNSAHTIITSTAPYNISRVSRSWRGLALSSPSQWSSFFLSFADPSDETLKFLIRLIEQHLKRSSNLLLTAFVRLEGEYDRSLSQAIAALLSIHQNRWRRVGIQFETWGGKGDIPIPKTQLFIEDLTSLEELRISFSTEYTFVSSSTDRCLCNSLLVTHLHLRTTYDHREAMRWLDLAPNLKVLNLNYSRHYFRDYASHPSYAPSYENMAPQLHMTHLRIVQQADSTGTKPFEFMLERVRCPALKELHLDPGWMLNNSPIRALCEFLRRNKLGALEVARLSVSGRMLEPDSIIEALTLMPSLRTFGIMQWNDNWNDITVLLQALARTSDPATDTTAGFALLPALETLEITSSLVQPPSLVEFVEARCRGGHGRPLKCVKLSKCTVRWVAGSMTEVLFPDFRSHEDLDRIPAAWMALKVLFEQGLRFVIEN